MRESFQLRVEDGTVLQGMVWKSTNEMAILQVVHGALDYALRYEPLAEWMTDHGVTVYVMDSRGHGSNQPEGADRVVIKLGDGMKMAGDAIALGHRIARDHPGKRIFLLGHSMGSFIVRTAAGQTNMYAGYILAGTSKQSTALIGFGRKLVALLGAIKGSDGTSRLLDELSFNNFQRQMKRKGLIQDKHEWLTSDRDQIERIRRDDKINQRFGIGAYGAMFDTVHTGQLTSTVANTRAPLLILTGLEDPLSRYGRTIPSVAERYRKNAHIPVTEKYYPKMRHEVLTGHDRIKVYQDILDFIHHEPNN